MTFKQNAKFYPSNKNGVGKNGEDKKLTSLILMNVLTHNQTHQEVMRHIEVGKQLELE